MKKIVKQLGNGKLIRFNKEDCEIYKIDAGDVLDIKIINLTKSGAEDEFT